MFGREPISVDDIQSVADLLKPNGLSSQIQPPFEHQQECFDRKFTHLIKTEKSNEKTKTLDTMRRYRLHRVPEGSLKKTPVGVGADVVGVSDEVGLEFASFDYNKNSSSQVGFPGFAVRSDIHLQEPERNEFFDMKEVGNVQVNTNPTSYNSRPATLEGYNQYDSIGSAFSSASYDTYAQFRYPYQTQKMKNMNLNVSQYGDLNLAKNLQPFADVEVKHKEFEVPLHGLEHEIFDHRKQEVCGHGHHCSHNHHQHHHHFHATEERVFHCKDENDKIRKQISEDFLRLVEASCDHDKKQVHCTSGVKRNFDDFFLEEDVDFYQGPKPHDVETDKKVYECSYPGCKRQFSWLWALKEHEKRHHQRGTKSRDFKCTTCGKGFFTKSCLKSHMKIHTRKPHSYKCKYEGCDKTYSTSEGLRLHIRNHHQVDKRWICPVADCGKKFVRQSDMRLHIMRIHAKTRPHPCRFEGCTKSFACYSELRRHEASHLRKKEKKIQPKKKRKQL